jgi:predicted phage replisome organizer
MFDDEKIRIIESMPEADTLIVLWIRLICMAGKTNDSGYVYLTRDIPYTIEQLAAIFGRPLNTVKLALEVFSKLEMVTLHENGTIFLPAFERHQNLIGMERVKENTRKRVAAFREKQKTLALSEAKTVTKDVTLRNVTVTQQSRVDIKSRKDTKNSIPKKKYGEFQNVLLTDEEYEKLKERFNSSLSGMIENLSTYMTSKGKKYASHYATLLNWERREEKEKGGQKNAEPREPAPPRWAGPIKYIGGQHGTENQAGVS